MFGRQRLLLWAYAHSPSNGKHARGRSESQLCPSSSPEVRAIRSRFLGCSRSAHSWLSTKLVRQRQRWRPGLTELSASSTADASDNSRRPRGSGRLIRRLALISDVHIFDPEGIGQESVTNFMNLRLLGLLNIWLLRGPERFSERILRAALRDMQEHMHVDHLILAGDITNLSLECEFSRAAGAFAHFAANDPQRITAVPGNHDLYNNFEALRRPTLFSKYFGQYARSDVPRPSYAWNLVNGMSGRSQGLLRRLYGERKMMKQRARLARLGEPLWDGGRLSTAVLEEPTDVDVPQQTTRFTPSDTTPSSTTEQNADNKGGEFPFIQLRGDVLFIGLNTALPGTAQGEVGASQWKLLRTMMDSPLGRKLRDRAQLRVMVLHHPAQDPDVRGLPLIRDIGHDLKDWAEIPPIAKAYNIDLVVHGHNHVPYIGWLKDAPNTLVLEGGSGTLIDLKHPERMARYTVFELDETGRIARIVARVWNHAYYDSICSLLGRPEPLPCDVFRTVEIAIPSRWNLERWDTSRPQPRKRTLFRGLPL
jgi:3',5'-cyclic AMP phosphodiesterase CpdA